MQTKGPLSTPFYCGMGKTPSPKGTGGNPGVYDKHTTPILSKPRDVGKDAPKEIFFEDIPGQPPSWKASLAGGTSMTFKK